MPASVAASLIESSERRFAVERLGRGGDAVRALAEEDAVQVGLEDLLLRELALHAEGHEHLRQLAAPELVGGEEDVARRLHVMVLAPCAFFASVRFTNTARSTPVQSTRGD